MTTVLADFDERVIEIELYFEHLRLIEIRSAQLLLPNSGQIRRIDPDLIKVLKANCFLLLYNLMESSIRLALIEIYDKINGEQLNYSAVIDQIKRIWIGAKHKNFVSKSNEDIFR